MKILFDHQTFSTQRYGGISRYFVNLHSQLNKLSGVSSTIAALYSDNAYINNGDVLLNNAFGDRLFNGHKNRIYRWNQRYSSLKIKQNNFDIFHPTYYDPYFLDQLKKPFVLTVHDMIHELMGNHFTDDNKVSGQKKVLIERAAAVIAISEHTKKDIIKFYPAAEQKTTVIHHGYQANQSHSSAVAIPEKYILFVGERYFYKNFTGFAKAIAPLLKDDKSLHLVCTAGGAFDDNERQLFADLEISEKCYQINATDTQMHSLYQRAAVFVFPSFIEGFGFPLLEAFQAGCPVAASNNSCFPEIGGGAALYFDPAKEASIYSAVESIINVKSVCDELVKKGSERLKLFTLEKQVTETLALYRKVANKA